jgi:SOS response regulatory protein OraA/RecX
LRLAVASLERKWNSLKQFDLERARTKAYTYLSRRGIGYAAAKAAFEQLTNRDNEAGND